LAVPQPDPELLRRAQRGDERAFTAIVRSYELPVHNYIFRLTGDHALAEDLTQDVFVRVHQALPRFSLRCKFTTWLYQVTKNRVLDELRARERRPQAVCTPEDLPTLATLDPPSDQIETVEAIWTAVRELNPDLKMALLLRDVVGLPYNEIADTLEVTLATVKWRIFKAREEVQRALLLSGLAESPPARSTTALRHAAEPS
jgi:RNA polymerase sigma-70 factor (ECF subfamily)